MTKRIYTKRPEAMIQKRRVILVRDQLWTRIRKSARRLSITVCEWVRDAFTDKLDREDGR